MLAHSSLALDFPGLSVERPLPRITEIGDPVLFEIWDEDWQKRRLGVGGSGHWHRLGDAEYLYLYRNLEPPLDPRWLVGSYFAAEAVDIQLDRLAGGARPRPPGAARRRDRRGAARPAGQPADRPAGRRRDRDPQPRSRRPAPLAALAAARDRPGRRRFQCHGARVARVRHLRAQADRAQPDQPGDHGLARLPKPRDHGAVHRHRRVHGAHDQPDRRADGGVPQSSSGRADRLHRGRRRHGRQVHRRCRDGALERDRGSGRPRCPRGARRARHRRRDPRGQSRARGAGSSAHRPAQRAGRGRQHRHRDAHELYGGRRYRERGAAARGFGQGAAPGRRGRDPARARRPLARCPPGSRSSPSAGTSCAAARRRSRSSRSRPEHERRAAAWRGWGGTAAS